jgi:tetratricopeptide (TPR) repeat protein
MLDGRLKSAVEAERFDAAVDALEAIESERALCPHELVLKARCLQLHPVVNAGFLSDAKDALLKALELDPTHAPALIELGWFHLNVEGAAADAVSAFERAFTLAAPIASEALVGLSRSTEETQSKAAAKTVFETLRLLDSELLREEQERLSEDE